MERFSNLTEAGVNCCRSIPKQEPFQVADPFNEFWAKETSASKNGNRSLTLFPFQVADPFNEFRAKETSASKNRNRSLTLFPRFLTPFPCPQE
jgi:hypothetical protein